MPRSMQKPASVISRVVGEVKDRAGSLGETIATRSASLGETISNRAGTIGESISKQASSIGESITSMMPGSDKKS